mmetsp:Transcript_7361/g.11175  ORF Transcript_7361/g.11175 Transcript_7361/m.11175 type:complete len:128 (+) Transcript_7361:64-447(+)
MRQKDSNDPWDMEDRFEEDEKYLQEHRRAKRRRQKEKKRNRWAEMTMEKDGENEFDRFEKKRELEKEKKKKIAEKRGEVWRDPDEPRGTWIQMQGRSSENSNKVNQRRRKHHRRKNLANKNHLSGRR